MDAGGASLQVTMSRSRTRIVLVEDHAILRAGLKALIELESDLVVVGDFGDVVAGLAGIAHLQPDVVLTDLELPGKSGVDLLGEIHHLAPLARTLVLTVHDSPWHIRAALSAGADGYVLKDSGCAELMLAIRTVMQGQQFFCQALAGRLLTDYLAGGVATGPALARRPTEPTITGREREVLTRVAQGYSNKCIARDLGVSPKTVEKHRSNLMRKLQLHNAAAITMFAIRHGLMGVTPAAAGRQRLGGAALPAEPVEIAAT